jgi:hypothetical protein
MASQEEVAIAAACVVIIGTARQEKKRMCVRPYPLALSSFLPCITPFLFVFVGDELLIP